jgi:DNA-binding CsgD family transcriptional regulator
MHVQRAVEYPGEPVGNRRSSSLTPKPAPGGTAMPQAISHKVGPALRCLTPVLELCDDAMGVFTLSGSCLLWNRAFFDLMDTLTTAGLDLLLAQMREASAGIIEAAQPIERITLEAPPTLESNGRRFDVTAALLPLEATDSLPIAVVRAAELAPPGGVSADGLRQVRAALAAALQLIGPARSPSSVQTTRQLEDATGASFTAREHEVLDRLLSGYRVPTISRELHLSEHTVRSHLKSVFRKTGVRSQSALLEKLLEPRD